MRPTDHNIRQWSPTHQCKICGTLWTEHSGPDIQGWSLYSLTCGKCCDNAATVPGQLVKLNHKFVKLLVEHEIDLNIAL